MWDNTGSTDEDGYYSVNVIAAGDYNVFFSGTVDYLGEWYNNVSGTDPWWPPVNIATVTVTEGETSDIDATLAPAGHITGTLRGPGGIALANGNAMAYRQVDGEWRIVAGTGIDEDGWYDIGSLPTGEYRVRFDGEDADERRYATEYYTDKPVLELSTPVAVAAGQTRANINAQLADAGTISGAVTFDAQAIESVRVELWFNTGATGWYLIESSYASEYNGYEYGRGALPVGGYKLAFIDEYDEYYSDIYYNTKPSLSLADVVNVTGGQDKIADQRMDSIGPDSTSDAQADYTGDASIRISATDAGVGVASISYSLDEAAAITVAGTSTVVVVPEDGTHGITYWATDKLGNVGPEEQATFTVTDGSGYETQFVPIQGSGRVATAVKASQAAFPSGLDPASTKTVVIATSMNWPDALGGTSLAGALDGPILLTDPAALPADVSTEIQRLGAQKAIILGGTGAVTQAVQTSLNGLLGTPNVERISGDNRYLTADKVAERTILVMEDGAGWDGTVFVATGGNFPDALAVAPIAASQGWPLVLSHPTTGLSVATKTIIEGASRVFVLGGTGAVSQAVETGLNTTFGDVNVTRLAGGDRYATAVVIAQFGVDECGLGWDKVAVTTGTNFPDALAGGVLQGKAGSVMVLTPPNSLAAPVQLALTENAGDITEVRFLGGTGAVSQAVRDAIALLLAQ